MPHHAIRLLWNEDWEHGGGSSSGVLAEWAGYTLQASELAPTGFRHVSAVSSLTANGHGTETLFEVRCWANGEPRSLGVRHTPLEAARLYVEWAELSLVEDFRLRSARRDQRRSHEAAHEVREGERLAMEKTMLEAVIGCGRQGHKRRHKRCQTQGEGGRSARATESCCTAVEYDGSLVGRKVSLPRPPAPHPRSCPLLSMELSRLPFCHALYCLVKTAVGGQDLTLGRYPSTTQAALVFARWLHAQEEAIPAERMRTSFGNMVIPAMMPESMEAGAINTIEKVLDIREVAGQLEPDVAAATIITFVGRRTKTTVAARGSAAVPPKRTKLSVALLVAGSQGGDIAPEMEAAPIEVQRNISATAIVEGMVATAPKIQVEGRASEAELLAASACTPQFTANRREFLIKKRGYSYFRSVWLTAEQIEADGRLSERALQRFVRKLEDGPIDRSYKSFLVAERVIAQRRASDAEEYLVKWNGLGYNECSWESPVDLAPGLVRSYLAARDVGSLMEAEQGADGVVSTHSQLKASDLELRLCQSAWAKKGMAVEAATAAKGLRGAWLQAKATKIFAKKLEVEYDELYSEPDHVTGGLVERLSIERVQPLPPRTPEGWQPKVGQLVQLAHGIGWWVAVVKCMRRRGEELADKDEVPLVDVLVTLAGKLTPIEEAEKRQDGQPMQSPASLPLGTTMQGIDGRSWAVCFASEATAAASVGATRFSRGCRQLGGPKSVAHVWTPLVTACEGPAERERTRHGTLRKEDSIHPRLKGRLPSKVPGSRIVVVYTESKGGPIKFSSERLRAAYRGVVMRHMPGKELLVRFDGYTDGDEAAECFVDEAGEDEWCWEEEFDANAKRATVAAVAANLAERTMWLVISPHENLRLWKSSQELRPNWEWRGARGGFVECDTLVGAEDEEGDFHKTAGEKEPGQREEESRDAERASRTGPGRDANAAAPEAHTAADLSCSPLYDDNDNRCVANAGYRDQGEPAPAAQPVADYGELVTVATKVGGWIKLEESPIFSNGRVLCSYQLEGLNWLRLSYMMGRNVILGDEMGLGKTVQSLAMLQTLRTLDNVVGPFLIIVPLSRLGHWEREVRTWTDMYCTIYHGSVDSRKVLLKYDWQDPAPSKGQVRYRFHMLLSTYETLLLEPEPLLRVSWHYLIVDEGHRLKNRNSRVLEVMRELRAPHKLVLTSARLQDHVPELWSILKFLQPSKFGDLDAFLRRFGAKSSRSDTCGEVNTLNCALKPYVLRREIHDVEASGYPMRKILLNAEITSLQKLCYRAVLQHKRGLLLQCASMAMDVTSANLSNISMMLRHCCNHPWLLNDIEKSATEWLEGESSVREPLSLRERANPTYWRTLCRKHEAEDAARYIKRLVQSSGKLVLLNKMLPKLKAMGHRVLLCSQFTKVLDLCGDLVEYRQWTYERVDAGVQGKERQGAIDRFNDPHSESFIFMLSAQAGGVSINLAAADAVILFEPACNLQNEMKTLANCHRIGKTKPVQVYQLCSKDTYEMHLVLSMASRSIDHQVSATELAKMKRCDEIALLAETVQPERLLRIGAQILLSNEQDRQAAEFGESSIEHILAHYTVASREGGCKGKAPPRSVFTQIDIVSGDNGGSIETDDPNFWVKMLPEESFELASVIDSDARAQCAQEVVHNWRPLPKRHRGDGEYEEVGPIEAWKGSWREPRAKEPAWSLHELQALTRALLAYGHHQAPERFAEKLSAGLADGATGESFVVVREMRSVKKIMDYMLTCWILRAHPNIQREWSPLKLHTRPDVQVLELASASDALVCARKKNFLRSVGGITRPRGRPPSNENGKPLVWSHMRGKWVDTHVGGVYKGQRADPEESARLEAERAELEEKLQKLRGEDDPCLSEPSTLLLRGLKVLEGRLRPACHANAHAWLQGGEGPASTVQKGALIESLEMMGFLAAPSACLERLLSLRLLARVVQRDRLEKLQLRAQAVAPPVESSETLQASASEKSATAGGASGGQ